MRLSHLARRFRLPIGTMVLLAAVVGWGLEYKVSLYEHGNPLTVTSSVPGKVLSDTDQCARGNGAAASIEAGSPTGDASLPVAAAGVFREPAGSEGELSLVSQDIRRERRSGQGISLRGPPRL